MDSQYLNSIVKQFEYYKMLGNKTFEQLSEKQLSWQSTDYINSISIIEKRLWGNRSWKEGYVMERTAKELYYKLQIKGNTNIYFKFFEKRTHGDVLHLAVYHAFEKFFRDEEK